MITSKKVSDSNPRLTLSDIQKAFKKRFGNGEQIQRIEVFDDHVQVIFSKTREGQDEFGKFQETRFDRVTRNFSSPSFWHEIQI